VRGSVFPFEEFADLIAAFPLPSKKCSIAGGFWKDDNLDQEHLAIDVYPVDLRGHIGVQVRIATELWKESRPESQMSAQLRSSLLISHSRIQQKPEKPRAGFYTRGFACRGAPYLSTFLREHNAD
jgi:hypothetical protein